MPPPSFKGKVKKLKDRPEQALSNLQINPNYVAAVTQNAQNQLDNIVKNKDKLQTQAGIININPNVVGEVFKDYKPGDKLNSAQQVFADFYGSSTPNAYQQELQNFIKTSPIHREVFKQSGLTGANLNLAAIELPEKIASSTGVGALINAMGKGKNKIKQVGSNIINALSSTDAKNLNTIQEEKEQPIETLGKQDPDSFGGLDRPSVVDDIFDPEASTQMASLDPEKIAMDAGLTPGTVYDPRQDDLKSKIDFVNQVFGTNFEYTKNEGYVNDLFQKAKEKQGAEISSTIQNQQGEQAPVAGQFNFENFISPYQDTITDVNLTGQMEPVDPNAISEEGVNKPATQAGQTLLFSDGTPVQESFDTGLDVVGDSVFPSDAGSQEALDILNSNATSGFSGYPKMNYNFANGGFAGMSTYQKLKMMADSIG
jgi:hypothetical protein